MSQYAASTPPNFKSLSNLFDISNIKLEGSGFSPAELCVSVLHVFANLDGKTLEECPLNLLKFEDTDLHADKLARKLLLFSCLKWFVEREREQDVLNFLLHADYYKRVASSTNAVETASFIFGEFLANESSQEIYQGFAARDKISTKLASRDPMLFHDVQEEGYKLIKNDFYAPIFKHPVFNTFATTVHSLLPALVKGNKEVDPSTIIRKSVYVLALMEALETFEVKDHVEVPKLGVDDNISFLLHHSIRRLLTFPLLKAYVDKELSMENITFWLAVTDYKYILEHKPSLSEAEKRDMAVALFDEYIRSGSSSEVNIQANLRTAMEAELKEGASISLFDKAQREVLQLLHGNSYVRFLKSQEYQEYVGKLKSLPDFYYLDTERRRKDDKFRDKYKLPPTETKTVEITCAMEGKNMTLHGSIQFSNLYACFHATVFGFKTREVIPLRNVESLEVTLTDPGLLDTDGFITFVMKDREYVFRGFSYIRRAYVTIRKLYKAALGLTDAGSTVDERIASPRREPEQETMLLTHKDWMLFQEGAKVVTYSKDTPILREGDRSRNMYQIARGRVRIEKGGQVLRSMDVGQFFGEISFLEGGSASATVLADESPTAVYIIDGPFIEGLLKVEPGLPGRFYNYLAIQLADRLRNRKITASAPVQEKKPKITNEKFQKMFSLPKDEELITTIPCSLEKMIRQHGTLYVSGNTLAFCAQIIGMKSKDVIPLKSVSTVTANEAAIEVTTDDNRELVFTGIENIKEAYEAVTNAWRTSKASRSLQSRGAGKQGDSGKEVVSGKVEVLSQKDMKMFLTGAKLITYKKDEAVLEEGSRARCLYQIGKGHVRVQKGSGLDAVFYRKLGQGELFGEMSFLEPVPASASIIADEDGVDIYVMERSYVESLLHLDPELPGRFYRFLASNLANRLRK